MINEAFIYDAIRTPRTKGKEDGSLHNVRPIKLLSCLLNEIKIRNNLDTSLVDDIVIGCVTPIEEQGSCIGKTAALDAGWDWSTPGMQLNRFCASGLESINIGAQKIKSGWEDVVITGGVESMSRVPMGSDGGAWINDSDENIDLVYV